MSTHKRKPKTHMYRLMKSELAGEFENIVKVCALPRTVRLG
jgi:hypothetical protein